MLKGSVSILILIFLFLKGNLCRCTGYRPIMEGYRAFATDAIESQNDPGCGKTGQDCCMTMFKETTTKSNAASVTDSNCVFEEQMTYVFLLSPVGTTVF